MSFTHTNFKIKLCFTLLPILALSMFLFGPLSVNADSSITIDSPEDGTTVTEETIRISGTYTNAYDIKLYINGETQVDVITEDSDSDDSGTWYYDLDTSQYNGDVKINARGLDIDTRYGTWSSSITIHVDNPTASTPDVTIINPDDGASVNGKVPIKVDVESNSSIENVQVRINMGAWQDANKNGNHYKYIWAPAKKVDKTYSIEARAIDTNGNIGKSLTTYAKVGQGTNEQLEVKGQDRAMWIWEPETYKLLLNPNARYVLNDFAKDTETFNSDTITTLYLAVGGYAGMDIIEDDPGKLRDFIKWAHGEGFQIHAAIAGGTSPPYMGAYEAYHDHAIREMEKIINFNLSSEKSEQFDGVNVDIEPYISQDFKTEYPSLQIQYLDGLVKMIERRNVAGINLPFGPAIPKWYDSSDQAKDITWNGNTKWLSEHVQDISDYISIMDYRDTADGSAGIIAGAEGEIAYANAIGKENSVVIGVETLDIANSGDPEVITFREEGRTHMESELDKVYNAFGENPYFGGIAVHHYDSIRTLPSSWDLDRVSWEPPADNAKPTVVNQPPEATTKSYHEINLTFGMAYDDTDIDRYIVYRSTKENFTPDPSNIAGLARGQSFNDVGLLPDTTYYYKVAAMDISGKIGPASSETAATTSSTNLKPMILTNMGLTYNASNASAAMKLVDKETNEPITNAIVEGRFNFAGGKYVKGSVDENGWINLSSENIPENHQIGFEPRRVIANGYYWAQAYDEPHITTLYPTSGLSNLSLSEGTLDFSTNKTSYSVAVANEVDAITVTPTAIHPESIITINGKRVSSGSPSQELLLEEGTNLLSIIVTNRDGTTDTYSINILREIPVSNVFNPIDDTYVFENDPDASFGSEELLEIADIPRADGGGDRLAFLKFDLSAYHQPVDTARLDFYVAEDLPHNIELGIRGYNNGNWDEDTMTWNNRLGGPAEEIGTISVSEAGWYSLDISDFINSSSGIVTIRFMDPKTRNTVVKLNSSENEANQPYVILNP